MTPTTSRTTRPSASSQLAQEYQDVAAMFRYAVETERRFYLANDVEVHVVGEAARP